MESDVFRWVVLENSNYEYDFHTCATYWCENVCVCVKLDYDSHFARAKQWLPVRTYISRPRFGNKLSSIEVFLEQVRFDFDLN